MSEFKTGDTIILVSDFLNSYNGNIRPFNPTIKAGVKAFLKKVGTSNDSYRYNDYELENAFNLLLPNNRCSFAYFYSSEFSTTRMVLTEKYIKQFEERV